MTNSNRKPKEVPDNKKWYLEDNPPTRILTYVIQMALVAGLIGLGSYIITESVRSPDFNICVEKNQSVKFDIPYSDFLKKSSLVDYVDIRANNLHWKTYNYPIYLFHEFESGNGTGIELRFNPGEISVKNTKSHPSGSNVTITINPSEIEPGIYNIRINGRGGGGVAQGEDVEIPRHFCWITVEINDKVEKYEQCNISMENSNATNWLSFASGM